MAVEVVVGSEAFERLTQKLQTFLRMMAPQAAQHMEDGGFAAEAVVLAVEEALDDWNSRPPPIGEARTIEEHPAPALLYRRALVMLLTAKATQFAQSGVSFNDGGAGFSDANRAQQLMAQAEFFNREYQAQAEAKKRSLNAEQGWGGVASEYGYGGWYD